MAKIKFSTKHLQIDKSNATMMAIIAVASFVVVFSLVASKALLSQRAYQGRVISEKEKTKQQIADDLKAADSLVTSYKSFVSSPENVLGGNPSGSGDKDGDNARLVLDALPSKYDFPALASTLEKILTNKNFTVDGIGGTDDQLLQESNQTSPTPQPVEMPFQLGITGSYNSVQDLMSILQKSIRPFNIQSLSLSGGNSSLQASINAKTYYQPEKSLKVTTKDVK